MKVFLGGTCNNSTWREKLIVKLVENELSYFNPVVADWTKAAQEIEIREKERNCNVHFYHITSAMTGVYSIAEIIDSSYCEKDTVMSVDTTGFTPSQIKSLDAVGKMLIGLGGSYQKDDNDFKDIIELLCYLRDDDEIDE